MSRNRLKTLCNCYPFGQGAIAAAEDPSENLFTEDFIFVGGSYLVFPGVVPVRSARLVRATVKWPAAFRRAVRLSERHSATNGTRSLDILHVAAAKSLRAVEFISFDGRQRALASATGLIVAP
jgi:hypothetical protein